MTQEYCDEIMQQIRSCNPATANPEDIQAMCPWVLGLTWRVRGDLVSRLVIGITRVILWLAGVSLEVYVLSPPNAPGNLRLEFRA